MKRFICVVLVLVMVLSNVSVCSAKGQTNTVEQTAMDFDVARATGHFSFNVKAQGIHYIENVLPLEAGETVRINASYSPISASIYVGLIDEQGKFYYANATNGSVNVSIEIEEQGDYRFAVVNYSTIAVSISGYVYY